MLGTLFGEAGEFTGRSLDMFADLRPAITNYLGGKVALSMMMSGAASPTTDLLQSLAPENKERGGNVLQQLRKGQ